MNKEIEKLVKPYYYEGQTEIDLSAVLKCIDDEYDIHTGDNMFRLTRREGCGGGCCGQDESFGEPQPLKPPHLYTEQEEKDLLELLKKLGK